MKNINVNEKCKNIRDELLYRLPTVDVKLWWEEAIFFFKTVYVIFFMNKMSNILSSIA